MLARRTIMYDYYPPIPKPPDGAKWAVVNKKNGYYILYEDESACFVQEIIKGMSLLPPLFSPLTASQTIAVPDRVKGIVAKLIIRRDIGRVGIARNIASLQFYTLMDAVIETACNGERKGVRVSSASHKDWFRTDLLFSSLESQG